MPTLSLVAGLLVIVLVESRMSSLLGAPNLKKAAVQPFKYDSFDVDDDDDFGGSPLVVKNEKKKKKSGDKKAHKEKAKGDVAQRKATSISPDVSTPRTRSSPTSTVQHHDDDYDDDYEYEADFEPVEEDVDDDYISSVASSSADTSRDDLKSTVKSSDALRNEMERRIEEETRKHDALLQQIKQDQQAREAASLAKQTALQKEIDMLKAAQADLVKVREAAANEADTERLQGSSGQHHPTLEDEKALALHRRRQRERERDIALKRVEEESAAHALFQRLAQDVREVFHELNLSVVAAEKERLIKDERYRREREMKDRKEDQERAERTQKESQEREAREEKFWGLIEQREEKFRQLVASRLQQDEAEREDRLKRDLEDRTTRLRNERELRENLEQLDKEQRAKAVEDVRQRDVLLLQTQLEEMKSHFRSQTEELRHQFEADRQHSSKFHQAEIAMVEKRHEAAIEQMNQRHAHQLVVVESHVANATKLEELTTHIHEEVEASHRLHEKLTQERIDALKSKEQHIEEQKAVLQCLMDDLRHSREEMEKERCRIAALATKFDLAVGSFTRNSEEDRRLFQEAYSKQETLRMQIEKDRKLMVAEAAHERKVLEQLHEEFLARKIQMMDEIHVERAALAKEHAEVNAIRERQSREEAGLLQSIHSREEAYRGKVEAIEDAHLSAQQMKIEHKRLLDEIVAGKELLDKERSQFETEKEELLKHCEEIQRRAEEAAASQGRLRQQLVDERAAKEKHSKFEAASRGAMNSAALFQVQLAEQQAIIQRYGA